MGPMQATEAMLYLHYGYRQIPANPVVVLSPNYTDIDSYPVNDTLDFDGTDVDSFIESGTSVENRH